MPICYGDSIREILQKLCVCELGVNNQSEPMKVGGFRQKGGDETLTVLFIGI